MINSVNIKNYKGIKNFNISNLNRINLFIGNNNSNKTSLLEAIFIGSYFGWPYSWDTIIKSRDLKPSYKTYSSFFNNLNTQEAIIIECFSRNFNIKTYLEKYIYAENEISSNPIDSLSLNSFIYTQNIDEQTNSQYIIKFADKFNPTITGKSNNSSEYALSKDFNESGSFVICKNTIDRNLADQVRRTILSGKRDLLIAELKKFDETINDIYADEENILFGINGILEFLSIKEMGAGIMTITDIITSLVDNPNFILIDEIEIGLHYESIKKIAKFIEKKIQENTKLQIFITTHSIDVIKIFSEISNINDENFQNITSAYRLEKKHNTLEVIEYSLDLKDSLENGWEIR